MNVRIKQVTLLSVLILPLCASSNAQLANTRIATVKIVAYSSYGYRIDAPPNVARFESLDDQVDFARKFKAGVAEGIPFGTYTIEAKLLGADEETRQVTISNELQTIVVGLPLGTLAGPTSFEFQGRLVGKPLPDARKLFVKLVGVYISKTLESTVDSKGEFEFTQLKSGKYLILVLSEQEILATNLVTIPILPLQRIDIDIGRDLSIPNGKW